MKKKTFLTSFSMNSHHANMSVKKERQYIPLLYSMGFTWGIYYFLIFTIKHGFWVLVRIATVRWSEADLTYTHNLCFEQRYGKISFLFLSKYHHFINSYKKTCVRSVKFHHTYSSHYENMTMQYTAIFHGSKNEKKNR